MQRLLEDLRFGLRMLMKRPGFTAVAVITLALGIGANTAIFSVINGVLLNPLPFDESDRLVAVWETRRDYSRGSVAYPNFADWRAENRVFEQVAAYRNDTYTLTGEAEPTILQAVIASPDLFPLLREGPQLGRTFLPEEEKAGSRVVVLGHGAWQKHFGADPNIAGRRITLSGKDFTVTGVMPPGFNFPVRPDPVDVWVSSAVSAEKESEDDTPMTEQRGFHAWNVIARLKSGATLEQAQADLDHIMGGLRDRYPGEVGGYNASMRPYLNNLVGDVRPALLVLFGAVGFVLLIACANVANLLLARAVSRQQEMAVRSALGAGWGRIVRQMLTESALLAVLGGAAGLLLATWGIDLVKTISPEELPRVQEVALDGRVLGFTALISLLTGVMFGLVPALRAARTDLSEVLKEGGRGGGESLRRNRARSALVIAEVALALMLLAGSGLLINSFLRLQRVNPGFDPEKVLTLSVDLPGYKYSKPEQMIGFNNEFKTRVERLPGVRSVGMVLPLPLSGKNAGTSFEIEGQPLEEARRHSVDFRVATAGYFSSMGIPFISGRDFTERDDLKSPPVVIVNEAMAERYFPNENPIGKRIRPGISITEDEPPLREIVGVVGSIRHASLKAQPKEEIYLPYTQFPFFTLTLVARTETDPLGLVDAVRNEVRAMDRELVLDGVKSLDQYLADSVAQPRFNTLLLMILAGVAVALATVGLYGVMSYSVAQRSHEIGLRMAMGAQSKDVLRLVVGQGMKLVLMGMGIGLASAYALTRLMESLLFGVSATDPSTFVAITLLLGVITLMACFIPARRATKVDPMVALRRE
jgi:putative ABC transport system permease protein